MRNIVILIILLFVICGCSAISPIVSESKTIDSVFIKEFLRDTVVVVTADSSAITALVECDSLGQAHLKELISLKHGIRTKPPSLSIKNNVLTSIVKVDSLAIYHTLKDVYKTETTIKEIVKIVEVNKLTWWQQLWIKSGKIATITIAVVIIFVVIKGCIKRRI